jgi:hypothetical protein
MNRIKYNNGSTILLREEDLVEYSDYRINQHTLQPIMNCELKVFSPPKNKIDTIDTTDIHDYSFKNK